jgi:hypothetical protein
MAKEKRPTIPSTPETTEVMTMFKSERVAGGAALCARAEEIEVRARSKDEATNLRVDLCFNINNDYRRKKQSRQEPGLFGF